MPECSAEERAVLDALAKNEIDCTGPIVASATIQFVDAGLFAQYVLATNAWQISLSRGAAGSDKCEK